MKSLLSYRDQRILKISELLILNPEPLNFEKIMEVNNCSLKTVYDDVAYLQETWGDLLKITMEQSTVHSENPSIADLMYMKQSIFKNTLALQIGMHLYFEGKKKMSQLINALHYSESKIRTELRKLNDLLVPIGINICLVDGYYEIQSKNNFVTAYLVALTILGSGLPEALYENRQSLMESSDIEQRFSFKLPALIKNEIFLADALLKIKGQENDLEACNIAMPSEMREFINDMWQTTFGTRLAVSETYFEVFEIIYFKASIFSENIFYMHRYNYFYDLFAQENTAAIAYYEERLMTLSEQWQIEMWRYREELLFMLYINIPDMRLYRSHHIAVHSDLGDEHSLVLLKRFKKYFFLHEFSIYEKDKDYDYIVTTSQWKLSCDLPEERIIQVSDFVTKKDYDILYKKIYY